MKTLLQQCVCGAPPPAEVGAADDLDPMAMSPALELQEPRSAHTREQAFTADH